MNKNAVTMSVLVFAFIGGFLIFYNQKPIPSSTQNNSDVSGTPQKWESKIDEQSGVTITVTPIDILSQSKEWKFNIAMNTHSVELQDPTKSTVLVNDKGKEYKPIGWDGLVQGHHMNGMIIFNQITPTPKFVEIKIRDVGGIPERFFKWDLKYDYHE